MLHFPYSEGQGTGHSIRDHCFRLSELDTHLQVVRELKLNNNNRPNLNQQIVFVLMDDDLEPSANRANQLQNMRH